jgi:AraC-like DNA-binding protein
MYLILIKIGYNVKVIPFSVPKTSREAFRIQVDNLPYLYDKLHQHPETQIMLIEKGEGTLIAGDYVGRFSAGSLYLIGSSQPHVFRNDDLYYKPKSKLRVQAVSIYFDERYAGESFWQLDELRKVHQFLLQAGVGYRIQGKTHGQLTQLINELTPLKGINKLIHFFQLLKVLSESKELIPLSIIKTTATFSATEGKRMNDIFQFTFNQSQRKIKIEEVAEVANLSVEAFCRYFKVRTRKTYTTFLNEVRVSNACKMLIEKEKNIQEICYDTGFANLSHFNRTFKKVTGKTPSSYVN